MKNVYSTSSYCLNSVSYCLEIKSLTWAPVKLNSIPFYLTGQTDCDMIWLRSKETVMDRGHAITIDMNKLDKIEVYIDADDSGTQHIFGINSGFSYGSPMNPIEWLKGESGFVLV